MNVGTWIAAATFATMVVSMLTALLVRVGRMELRVDEMWKVFMQQPAGTPARGRRKYDRTLLRLGQADDRPKGKVDD